MNLVPWRGKHKGTKTPEGSGLSQVRAELDRLLEQFWNNPLGLVTHPFGERGWVPPVDVAESDTEVTIRAELPGVDPEQLDITVSENTLVLAGEKQETTQRREGTYHQKETRYGAFRRSVTLPPGCDTEQIQAEYKDGVLTIRVRKQPEAMPKRIEVRTV